jgi:hypothetical protein
MLSTKSRLACKIDTGIAVTFGALSIFFYVGSRLAAADAERRYGRNVDSGVLEYLVAILYLAPVALAFAVAALSLLRNWRIRWYIHWIAVAAAILPVIFQPLLW